jgi:DNA adenine methylase
MKQAILASKAVVRVRPAPMPVSMAAEPRKHNDAARPFLKWAGGKSQILSQIRLFFPQRFNSYFEPFLGGGAVYFDLKPANAHLNDINSALIASYNNLKRRPNAIIDLLQKLHREYLRSDEEARKTLFYRIRKDFNKLENALPRKTAYLIFLNKTCFNGMYRESATGQFNVPFGKYENPTICDENNLRRVSATLKTASLSSVSFDQAVQSAKKGDFVYFDPPYHPLSKTSSFTSYHARSFSEADQVKLRDVFVDLHNRGCFVMLSNSHTAFIQGLYRDFPQHTVMASRAINCKATGRGKIRELVITSYRT